jgi:phospholipase C
VSISAALAAAGLAACVPKNPHNLPVNHIVVLMQENRSADNYLGQLNAFGQTAYEAEPTTGNPDPLNPLNPPIVPFHETAYCESSDLNHSWNGEHSDFDNGAMDGFTAANDNTSANPDPTDPSGARTMGYYTQADLPFYYGLYNTFATNDRYFQSVLSQTFPNRLYLYAATSFGVIANNVVGSTHTSIFNELDANGVDWKIYSAQYPVSFGSLLFKYVSDHAAAHVFPISQYYADATAGTLPSVSFVDPRFLDTPTVESDEHPPSNIQVGQKFVSDVTNALMSSPNWSSSAMFLTYDENGGFYDHVAPPSAPVPDNVPPNLKAGDTPGAFNRYGFRVPVVVISPFSKQHYVSHVVDDHTSITRFIELRFGMPAMTNRDLNADPMLDMFDFSTPHFLTPPTLPTAVIDATHLAACPQPPATAAAKAAAPSVAARLNNM